MTHGRDDRRQSTVQINSGARRVRPLAARARPASSASAGRPRGGRRRPERFSANLDHRGGLIVFAAARQAIPLGRRRPRGFRLRPNRRGRARRQASDAAGRRC